jgi:hypothetical protein
MGATRDCDGGPAIGIDLGTTYSCVAVWRPLRNRVEVIPNDLGNLTTPSCVAFTDTWRLIGDAAVNQAAKNPVNTIFGKNQISSDIASWLLFCMHNFWRFTLLHMFTAKSFCHPAAKSFEFLSSLRLIDVYFRENCLLLSK